MVKKLTLKRIKNIGKLEKLLPHDDADGEFYLLKDNELNRVFIKRLSEPHTDRDYCCNDRYFINYSPTFEESDFAASAAELPLIDQADEEFHEYKDYGDMEYELKFGEFELYALEIGGRNALKRRN